MSSHQLRLNGTGQVVSRSSEWHDILTVEKVV